VALPEHGVIWTWTVQRFPPKAPFHPPPGGFEPFAVGYVDLDCVLVESVIVGAVDDLAIGQPVHLTSHPIPGSDDQFSFAFRA
jgi:uncharacterized OB-fold protein